jgi:hypothetical protein
MKRFSRKKSSFSSPEKNCFLLKNRKASEAKNDAESEE